MAAKIPIRTVYTSGEATGLAEFQSGEFVDYTYGGTGLAALGSAGQVLTLANKTVKPDTLTVLADAGSGYSKLALTTDYTLASNTVTLVNGITSTGSPNVKVVYPK